ncbi:MAG TPA: hypothetical protein VL495_05135 [Edaphobacter sp.]|nr:hypothetical protein [Edaphobacter sp.]
MLSGLPGITEKKTETHVTFLAGTKIFAFSRGGDGSGVALKLPRERIAQLLKRKEMATLTMGKRTMKEWVLLDHKKLTDYSKDLDLFREAMEFVSSAPRVSKKKR